MAEPLILNTPRLILRDWRDDDIEAFIRLRGEPAVMKYFPGVHSPEKVRKYFPDIVKNSTRLGYGFRPVILRETNEFLGFCGIAETRFKTPFGPITEIGWSLHAKFWGNGYAPEAATAWLEYAFQSLGKPEIVAFTPTNNFPSQSVMKKLGMERTPARDFDHPNVPDTHPELKRHIVYSITKQQWESKKGS